MNSYFLIVVTKPEGLQTVKPANIAASPDERSPVKPSGKVMHIAVASYV